MTDYLNRFGSSGAGTSSASAVLLENVLDFGPIDPDAAMQTHRTGEAPEETIVFSGDAAKATIVRLQHSDDNSAFTTIVEMPVSAVTATGDFAFMPFPKSHKRYVRAGIQAVANAPLGAVSARIEPGAALRS